MGTGPSITTPSTSVNAKHGRTPDRLSEQPPHDPLRGTHGFARSFETVVLVDDARLSEGGVGLVRSAYGTASMGA